MRQIFLGLDLISIAITHACNLLYVTSPQNKVTDVSFVLKDSDIDSENLSSSIRLSVSDGQKTDSSYRYIIK